MKSNITKGAKKVSKNGKAYYHYEEYKKEWDRKNATRLKQQDADKHIKKKYGLTRTAYDKILMTQGGGCAICGNLKNRMCVDHEHESGLVRGVLCVPCNTALGALKDNPVFAYQASGYLNKFTPQKSFVVGIGHKARHGKDTVASMLHERIPRHSKIYSFGYALKAWARVQGVMTNKDPALLQSLGTNVLRGVDPDIFVKALSYQIREDSVGIAIISDLRFVNEAAWVERFGISVKISRINEDGSLYIASDRNAAHHSETALDEYCYNKEFSVRSGDIKGLEQVTDTLYEICMGELTKRGYK